MKLYRFVAPNNQKVLMKVNEVLGLDALLYETRATEEGVEVLAGLPDEQTKTSTEYELSATMATSGSTLIESTLANALLIEQLQSQIKTMDENIQNLISSIQVIQLSVVKSKRSFKLRWNPFKTWINLRKSIKMNKEVYNEQSAH